MERRLKQWLPLFEDQANSGLSKNEWCKKHGIKRWEFYRRLKECREYLVKKEESIRQSSTSSFVEVPIDNRVAPTSEPISNTAKETGRISVTCGRFRISLEGKVDQETLAALIREVSYA